MRLNENEIGLLFDIGVIIANTTSQRRAEHFSDFSEIASTLYNIPLGLKLDSFKTSFSEVFDKIEERVKSPKNAKRLKFERLHIKYSLLLHKRRYNINRFYCNLQRVTSQRHLKNLTSYLNRKQGSNLSHLVFSFTFFLFVYSFISPQEIVACMFQTLARLSLLTGVILRCHESEVHREQRDKVMRELDYFGIHLLDLDDNSLTIEPSREMAHTETNLFRFMGRENVFKLLGKIQWIREIVQIMT